MLKVSSTEPLRRGFRLNFGKLGVHLVLAGLSLFAVIPFLIVIAASFSTDKAIAQYGYSLLPQEFTTLSYDLILKNPGQIFNAYTVTIFVTLCGTFAGLLIMSMLAYVLSRRYFRPRRAMSFYIFFTMLFNGGLVPWYILITQYLHLKNTIWVLILPSMVSAWSVFLLRAYFAGLPQELMEAAKIDGASEWRIFFQIVIPLSTPVLATIGLFTALSYWNDWWLALLFIDDKNLYPLQYLLYNIENNIQFMTRTIGQTNLLNGVDLPTQSLRMAMVVMATGPVILSFVFVQKYFVRGITLGGVKGD